MAWIESHQTLRQHPKTKKLSRKLGVSIPAAIGHLHCLWWWALDYADDGDLSRYDKEDIADAAMWEVEHADIFVSAMISAGLIDETDTGYVLHDWSDYAGKLIERREANRERTRKWREKRTEKSPKRHVTHTKQSRDRATEPDPTKPDRTTPDITEQEQKILSVLQNVKNYPYDEPTDIECIRSLATDYPDIDLLQELKHWATWVLDKPLVKGKSKPRSQIRNWIRKARGFQDRDQEGQKPKNRRDQSFEDYMKEAMTYAPE